MLRILQTAVFDCIHSGRYIIHGSAACCRSRFFSDSRDGSGTEDDVADSAAKLTKAKLDSLLESFQTEEIGRPSRSKSNFSQRKNKQSHKISAQARQSTNDSDNKMKRRMETIVGERMTQAVREVAREIGDDQTGTVENDLLKRLSGVSRHKRPSRTDLGVLLGGMQVQPDREQQQSSGIEDSGPLERPRGRQRARGDYQQNFNRATSMTDSRIGWTTPPPSPQSIVHVELLSGRPLGIFSGKKPAATTLATSVSTEDESGGESGGESGWSRLQQRQVRLMASMGPRSQWQEMADWTESGRLWPLPIDNELGCEEEASVGFHQHVLLERHLEPWCPRRGPVRKFMELVCIGLSKNYMFTVDEKREHIGWYEQFFTSKRKLLEELDCFPSEGTAEKSSPQSTQ